MELPVSYLAKATTFEQAAIDNLHNGVPFGRVNDDWKRLLDTRREGDELWYFEPPERDSIQLWGVALVRDRRIISTVITAVD